MSKLAILGGNKIRTKLFPAYNTIDKNEEEAVLKVLRSGKLSQFLGCWHDDFYGGEYVNKLENEWAKYFGVKHAISVNSATSALYAAIGAIGLEPGEEVIVSPYTMAASATAPLIYNGIPVFADIDEKTFIIDPKSIEKHITRKTRAIIVVDIFGHPYDADVINKIAKDNKLFVIEDCAQAPGAKYKGKFAGTLGDIGIFSLNYHKHIHCGEGGILVTDNDELAERLRLIRNHAEAVVEAKGVKRLDNMMGFNFRMTELEAAVAGEQLKKLNSLLLRRRENVKYIEEQLSKYDFLEMPKVMEGCEHSYYVHGIKYNEKKIGIARDVFVNAVKAELTSFELRETEGVKFNSGYIKPLYLLPMFKQRMGYGKKHYPFKLRPEREYFKGLCPVVEDMYENKMIIHEMMVPSMNKEDMDDFIAAIDKVYFNCEELKNEL